MALVLVVDDHPAVARAVAVLVQTAGHRAAVVDCGAAALAFLRERPVDVVVLDVMMPSMSGLDVLRAWAADGTVPDLPVIMFSADDRHRDESLRLGAVDFVLKTDGELLLPLVRRHAGRRNVRQPTGRGAD